MIHIKNDLTEKLSSEAKRSKRLRKNYNFHKEYSDNLQRLLNAMEPNTYVRPHKHENPDKTEVFIVFTGSAMVVEFDDSGKIIDNVLLDNKIGNYAVEIPPRRWHTVVSLEKGTVLYEIKHGPYSPIDDKNFASWAPPEEDENANEYLNDIINQINKL